MKTRRTQKALLLAASATFIACSGEREVSGRTGAADSPDSASVARGSAAEENVDHSTMTMPGDTAMNMAGSSEPADMAGMDHSTMAKPAPGVAGGTNSARGSAPAAPRAGNKGGMAGMGAMDHSGMDMSPPRPQTRTSSGAAVAAAPRMSGTSGMGHGGMSMPGSAPTLPADPALEKLQQMVRLLTRDPLVRQRIQADTALRNRWTDPEVRRIILGTR
jgi:hypothetical protein